MRRPIAIFTILAFILSFTPIETMAQDDRAAHIKAEIRRHHEAIKRLRAELHQIRGTSQADEYYQEEGAVSEGGIWEDVATEEVVTEGVTLEESTAEGRAYGPPPPKRGPKPEVVPLHHGPGPKHKEGVPHHRPGPKHKPERLHKPRETHRRELGPEHKRLPGKRVGPGPGPGKRVGPPDKPRGRKAGTGQKRPKDHKPAVKTAPGKGPEGRPHAVERPGGGAARRPAGAGGGRKGGGGRGR